MHFRSFLSIVFFLLVCSCNNPNRKLAEDAPFISENYKDDRGHHVSFSRPPTRIVSLAPSITELLFAMGAGNRVVARSHVCNYPPDATDLPEIRTWPQLNHELVFSFKPDLILGTQEIQKASDLEFFEEKNIPVMMLEYKSTSDIYRHIRELGKILNLDEKANRLADSLEGKEKKLSEASKNQIKYPTLVLVSVDPLVTVGGSSFMNQVISEAGGKNIFEGLSEAYPHVTEEAIIKAQPEFLIFASYDDKIYSKLIEKYPDLHTKLPASLSSQVFILNPDLLVRPGPRTIEGIASLISALHPRLSPYILLEDENADSSDATDK